MRGLFWLLIAGVTVHGHLASCCLWSRREVSYHGELGLEAGVISWPEANETKRDGAGLPISSKDMLTFFHYGSLLKVLLSSNGTKPSTHELFGDIQYPSYSNKLLHCMLLQWVNHQHDYLYPEMLFGNFSSILTVPFSSVFMVLDFCEDPCISSLVLVLLLLS